MSITDSDQNEITFITYFCMLNHFKEQSDDKGFVLKKISEMKWGSTFRSTARNEHFKENRALRAVGDDNNANGDEGIEKAEDLPRVWEKNPTWFELLARILGFRVEIKELLSNTEFAT
jgi:hypothetical protein